MDFLELFGSVFLARHWKNSYSAYFHFVLSMNVESPVRSIKRYSSKITIHRLENSVIRLWITSVTRRQQFPYVSMKTFREIPENNRRSRERLDCILVSIFPLPKDQGCHDSLVPKAWEHGGGGKRASFRVVEEVTRGRTRMLVDKLNTRGVTI